MKKIFNLFLSFAIIFSLTTNVFAIELTQKATPLIENSIISQQTKAVDTEKMSQSINELAQADSTEQQINSSNQQTKMLTTNFTSQTATEFSQSGDFIIEGDVLVAYLGKDENVVIPSNLGIKVIGSSAFAHLSSTKTITIPEGVVEIGDSSFQSSYLLEKVITPSTLTKIGNWAFSGCLKLLNIGSLDNVSYIGGFAFSGTPWYNNQPNGLVYIGKVAYLYKGIMPVNSSITIKDGTTSISGNAFFYCTGLTSITIPNSVTSIGNSAFFYCTGLTSVTIPNSVTSIGNSAFSYCKGLTSITIPNSVTSIGDSAFSGCTNLNVLVKNGSYAHNYAINNLIKYTLSEDKQIENNNIKLNFDTTLLPADTLLAVANLTTGSKFTIAQNSLSNVVSKFTAFDISVSSNGSSVQPNGKVKITMPIPVGYDKTKIKIYYIDELGNKTLIPCTINGEFVEFETDHFSMYAIAEQNVMLGDPNADTKIDGKDIAAIVMHITKVKTLADTAFSAGDVNKDGKIDGKDIAAIVMHITKVKQIVT